MRQIDILPSQISHVLLGDGQWHLTKDLEFVTADFPVEEDDLPTSFSQKLTWCAISFVHPEDVGARVVVAWEDVMGIIRL